MANKRMFSKDIVACSRFIMLPHTAQNLYYHLGVHADDDGYCEYVSVMRLIVGDEKDLLILQEGGFVCVYDLYTLCIQDWYIHNKIPPSRYAKSKYLITFPDRDLDIKEQYNPVLKACIQDVHNVSVEGSIDKGSIGKVRKEKKDTREKDIALPDWLNKTKWAEFVQSRKEMKKSLTSAAIKLNLKILEADKKNQATIIDNAIRSSWQGLHPLKNGSTKKPANHLEPEKGKYDHLDK